MYLLKNLCAMLLMSMFSLTASALVLEQAPLDGGDGYLSVGPAGTQSAENFQFTNNVTLTSISWWGSYDPNVPGTESFIVRIFGNNGASDPLVNSLYETTFTGIGDTGEGLVDLFGAAISRYEVSINWFLQGGVDYYLSIFSNDGSQDWYWLEGQSGDNTGWYRALDGDSWIFDTSVFNMAFRLVAEPVNIPEPATLFLVLLPLLWFGKETLRKINRYYF